MSDLELGIMIGTGLTVLVLGIVQLLVGVIVWLYAIGKGRVHQS